MKRITTLAMRSEAQTRKTFSGNGNETRIVKSKAASVKDAKRMTLNETGIVTDKRFFTFSWLK